MAQSNLGDWYPYHPHLLAKVLGIDVQNFTEDKYGEVKHASVTLTRHMLAARFEFPPEAPSGWPTNNTKCYVVQLMNGKRAYQIEYDHTESYVDISGEVLHGRSDLFFFPLLRAEAYNKLRGFKAAYFNRRWFWKGLILEHTGVQGQFKRCGMLSIKSHEKTPGWMRFKYLDWIESVKEKVQRRGQSIPKLREVDGNKLIISII
jgi:hypothetical protein